MVKSKRERELIEALLDVVNQSCQVRIEEADCIVSDLGQGMDYRDAIDLLERLGYAAPLGGREWRLRWPE